MNVVFILADLLGYDFCGFALVAYSGFRSRPLLILIIPLAHPHPSSYPLLGVVDSHINHN
jgi:hypothetical protein